MTAREYNWVTRAEVAEACSGMVLRGSGLSYLAIMLRVAWSFTDKPNGSNSIEQELSVGIYECKEGSR
jgi:hypothetical protein